MVGEIIIKTKLALEQFEKDFDKLVEESKEKGKEAGEALSKAFNKAVNIGKGLLSVVGKIGTSFGKILFSAGAIGGILGAAGVGALSLSGAIKKIVEDNDQLKANIQYIVFALSKAVEPIANSIANIIQRIINLLFQAIQYTAYLIKAWTGKNIFAGATMGAFAEYMKEAEKSSEKTAKNAKEINKQLTPFDEMNVLSDKSSSGGGVGGSVPDFEMPDFDLSKLNKMEVPKWLEWLAQNGKKLIPILTGIVSALTLMKLGLGGLKSIGIGIALAGIVQTIQGILDYIKDPSWWAFNEILSGIGTTLVGIGVTMVAINASNPIGWIILLTGAIIAMTTSIADSILTEQKNIDMIKNETIQQEELTKAKERAKEAYDNLINAVDRQSQAEENLIDVQNRTGLSGEELWKSVENGTLKYQDMTKEQKETYKAYLDLINANENLKDANEEKIASDSRVVKSEFDVQIANAKSERQYEKLRDSIVEAYNKGEMTAEDASDSISRMMGDMSVESYDTFVKDVPDNIKKGLKPEQYKTTFDKFKEVWNSWLNGLKKKIGIEIETSGGGGHGFAKGGVVLPRLASGGIINQPGRGVPLASAIGGESGREGVIPLTDSQQMSLLGEAIGKYITVNNVNPIYLNGRQIAREVNISNNESDFAFNR